MNFESVQQAFEAAAARWPDNPFFGVLEETARIYGIPAGEITYRQAKARVDALAAAYRAAGWGAGHRIALLLENRPDFVMHWLAINTIGASIVPINPDLRSEELRYMIGHSEMALAVAIPARHGSLREASDGKLTVIAADDAIPAAAVRHEPGAPLATREAGLLYTSGTTGLPKGCVVSNTWFLETGYWYLGLRGAAELHMGSERMLTPLPLFHMNALAASTMAIILAGGCLFVLDRFHPKTWWTSVARVPCHGHPLSWRDAGDADGSPTLAGGTRPPCSFRVRRGLRPHAARAGGGTVRVPPRRGLGDDGDRVFRLHHRRCGAAARGDELPGPRAAAHGNPHRS